MANDLSSNITRKLLRSFIPEFEKQRVLTKTCNTQLFQGQFTPSSGDYVDVKRPHQYLSTETATGDISSVASNDIIAGKATAQVQNYITVPIEWTNKEEALELDQLSEITRPAAEELVTRLETNFCDFIIKEAGLSYGDPDQVINEWKEIAGQRSLLDSLGVPSGEKYCVLNPFALQNLAGAQTGLSADPSRLVQTAWEQAQIASPQFAGMRVVASNSLSTYVSSDAADRAGTLSGAPTATYLAHKDSYKQTLAVTGFTANAVLKAGDILEFSGTGALARSRTHFKTHKTVFGADGNPIPWRATVTADVTLGASGEGNVVVAGPAIYESKAYDNISAALTTGDVVDVLGTADKEYQPALFYHQNAFAIAYVKLPKLYSTDTVAVTSDGISIRCSKYSDGDKNEQKIRFDLLPAFSTLNPFFAGKGYGLA